MAINPVAPLEIPLAQGWQFALDPEDRGEALGWQAIEHDARSWEAATVPHTWNTLKAYAGYEGTAWYRLTFRCPLRAGEGCVRLKFDAVFYLARVWLNGEYLGEHEGGYTPFEFDVRGQIRAGSANVLVVRVDNRRATDRLPAHLFEGHSYGWNNYGGIVREVKLVLTSQAYIATQRVIAVPALTSADQASLATVTDQISIRNASNEPFTGRLAFQILEDASRKKAASGNIPIHVPLTAGLTVPLEARIPAPLLWHFDHPNLYRCVLRLEDAAGVEYHQHTVTFGIRSVSLQNGRLVLNGEPVRLVGLSRHADVPGYGLAEPISVMAADFNDLKSLNMVIGRPVHYPQHEFIYDYCDRKGILLSPELPAWQLTAGQMADEGMRRLACQQLAEMIQAAANHPCIWAWSVGNELESDTVAGRDYVRDMVAFVKTLDSTRPVGFASYHLSVGRPWADSTRHADFVMMNQYFGTWHGPKDSLEPALDTVHSTWPYKIVIISEFGFSPHWEKVEGPAVIDPSQYYILPEDASASSPEADVQRQRVIQDQMAIFRKKSFVAGAIYWEYRGGMGVVDENNHRRESWQCLRYEFTPVMIEKLDFSSSNQHTCHVQVKIRTRGPIESELPAYTLRGYRLQWELVSPNGSETCSQGELKLPDLTPGTTWVANIETPSLPGEPVFRVKIMRPTGFMAIEKVCPVPPSVG